MEEIKYRIVEVKLMFWTGDDQIEVGFLEYWSKGEGNK